MNFITGNPNNMPQQTSNVNNLAGHVPERRECWKPLLRRDDDVKALLMGD
jgi:hypothetical protein